MLVPSFTERQYFTRICGFFQSELYSLAKTLGSMARKCAAPNRQDRPCLILGIDRHFDKIAVTDDCRRFVAEFHVHSTPNIPSTSRQESSESDTLSRVCNRILPTDETVSEGLRITVMPERVFLLCSSYIWNKFLCGQAGSASVRAGEGAA